MDTWRSDLMDALGDMSRDDRLALAYVIEMAERDYENHLQKKEKDQKYES